MEGLEYHFYKPRDAEDGAAPGSREPQSTCSLRAFRSACLAPTLISGCNTNFCGPEQPSLRCRWQKAWEEGGCRSEGPPL